MKNLLVFSYFCPSSAFRPGGVQQVVGPLLDAIALGGWAVSVAHTGPCAGSAHHVELVGYGNSKTDDHVEPDSLVLAIDQFTRLAAFADVVLSIDRVLPVTSGCPRILMSNSLAYVTEATAALSPGWAAIITPSLHAAGKVRQINRASEVHSIPYGFPNDWFDRLARLDAPPPNGQLLRFTLPHRPDFRKGQKEAILGLATSATDQYRVELELTWLDEPRYLSYREELEALVLQKGLSDQVSFTRWHSGDNQWASLQRSHGILQIGSFVETFGLSVLEAIISGRVAITGHQPAIREVIGVQRGLSELVPGGNWVDEAIKLVNCVPNDSRVSSPLKRQYSLDHMSVRYLELLERVAAARSNRRRLT